VSGGIAQLFLKLGTRRECGVSVTPRPRLTPGKDPVTIVQEAGWASGPVWTGAENLAPTRIRSSDLPARSESLYRLRYPGSIYSVYKDKLKNCSCNRFQYIFTIYIFTIYKYLPIQFSSTLQVELNNMCINIGANSGREEL
jgi:hypothetical protein